MCVEKKSEFYLIKIAVYAYTGCKKSLSHIRRGLDDAAIYRSGIFNKVG